MNMKMEEFFYRRPVFTNEELSQFLASRIAHGPRTQESLLAYYTKIGRLVRVRRGLYVVVSPGGTPDTYSFDPFLLAAKMTKDAVLGYHTALEIHGKAYSTHRFLAYLSNRPLRPLSFRSQLFRGVKFPQTLLRKGKENYAVVQMDRVGLEIRVTSLERTLVDVMNRPDLSGTWEEIWRSLESVEFFDLDKVVEYALLLENSTTAAKVGFFLEQHREPLMVDDAHLKPLRDLRPKQPHYLERRRRKAGRLATGWNLVVPTEVFERSWAEVL
jgi:predicted transcriptional regulator of viral defense system